MRSYKGGGMKKTTRSTKRSIGESTPLPIEAFRLSMLQGSMPVTPRPTGFNNIPLDSQSVSIPPLECRYAEPRVDYFSCMFSGGSVSEARELLERNFDVVFTYEVIKKIDESGSDWQSEKGSRGASFAYRSVVGGGYRMRFSGGGLTTNGIPLERLGTALGRLRCLPEFSCTRIDYNVDSRFGELPIEKIAECLRTGDYIGYRCGEIIESVGGKKAGITVYFGGRKSLQRVRFYDKEAESGVEGAGVRHEVQCRGGLAAELVDRLADKSHEDICRILLGKLAASVSFGTRRGKNLDRFVPADFWTEWVTVLNCMPIGRAKITRRETLDKTISWMGRTVSKAMAMLSLALESTPIEDVVRKLIEKGSERVRASDMGNIEDWRVYRGESNLFETLLGAWYHRGVVEF